MMEIEIVSVKVSRKTGYVTVEYAEAGRKKPLVTTVPPPVLGG